MIPEIPIERFEIFAGGLDHSECIAFDRGGDFWAGGEEGQIYRISPDGKVRLVTTLGGFCGGLAFSPQDELFVCNLVLGIVRVEPDGEFEEFATDVGQQKIIYPKFRVFDSSGNDYVTDSGNWKKNNGFLLRFTPNGKGEILGGPFGYANGFALSTGEKSFYGREQH